MSNEVPSRAPLPPNITRQILLRQFWADIYGKEVQSAATYSYTWMADQMGHVCIGLLLGFATTALAWNIPGVAPAIGWQGCQVAGFLTATLAVSYWEYRAFRTDVSNASGVFPLGRKLLRNNAIIAAAYMVMGAAVAWAFHNSVLPACAAFVAVAVVAIACAPPWLRQKITWQKAGLPYLARLADTKATISPELATRLWSFIESVTVKAAPPRQVIVAGVVGSGRTSLASGIGTELAFRNISVRYLNFANLTEFAATKDYEDGKYPPGPANIAYWPWSQAQVLIVDDVGPMLSAAALGNVRLDSAALETWLTRWLGPILPTLGVRHTIWVLGETGAGSQQELDQYTAVIATALGGKDPLAILLGLGRAEVTSDVVNIS